MSMIIEKAATFNDDLSVDMSADNFLSGGFICPILYASVNSTLLV